MKKQYIASVILTAVTSLSAIAADKTLDFRLITKRLEGTQTVAKNVEGQSSGLFKIFGVAYFSTGQIAVKEFVHSQDFIKGSGPFSGYSTYTFEDGASLTVKYTGNLIPGKPMHGDYVVLSGTGIYEGATGTGYFESAPHKYPDGAYYVGQLKIHTP